MLSLVALVFNLGMEWRHKTKIKFPTKILAEVKVLSFCDVLTRCARALKYTFTKEEQVQTEHRIACVQYIYM